MRRLREPHMAKKVGGGTVNYLSDSLFIIICLYSCNKHKISCYMRMAPNFTCFNYLNEKKHSNLSFCPASCNPTELPTKDLKTDLSSSISIFYFPVSTRIFWFSVLEITASQNDNFWCSGRQSKTRWQSSQRLVCEMQYEARLSKNQVNYKSRRGRQGDIAKIISTKTSLVPIKIC